MTQEEQEFAEQKHDLVIDYLRRKGLPMDDYYDIVIFGYVSSPASAGFSTISGPPSVKATGP